MIFPRTVLIASTMLLAASVHAADVGMANGQVHFTTPNGWLDIMETEGDPEARVFQVPDPSPTAQSSLARVTVTVKQTADIPAFQQYVGEATAKAAALPGYTATAHGGANNTYTYTAQEAGAQFNYSERYWYKGNHSIQLRCVRPQQSQAGATWAAAFDKGCDAIAAQLK
ncbi:MAG TPA: hypothetical protein VLZ32_08040 [Rhodanobacter sp.]|nr:hypothetical protein [Rhodanobacter sp.]